MASARSLAGKIKRHVAPEPSWLVEQLIRKRMAQDAAVSPYLATMSDDEARVHFGGEAPLDLTHIRLGVQYFHAWRVQRLRERIPDLDTATILDVGDSDGLMLRALGKEGTAVNTLPEAIELIRANRIEAVLGQGESLPFADGSFDYVLCFQTLEHVESPYDLLAELARVARKRVFISIPGVDRTHVVPRDFSAPRGTEHCFEFNREDFIAFTTHTSLETVWDETCNLLATPASPAQRLYVERHRSDRAIAGTFTRFRLFELKHRT